MTPYTAINLGIRDYDRSDPASATNASRRLQCLAWLQQMQDYIECYPGREWYWTFAEGMVTILEGDRIGDLPADFMEFGRNGGLYDASKRRWDEISIHMLMRMRYETNVVAQFVFAKAGQGALGATIQIPAATTSTLVLPIVYRSRPPILVDDAGTEEVPAAEFRIPDVYARTVILPALVRKMQQSKDDARPDWAAELRDGLSLMSAQENEQKTGEMRIPMVYPGAW